jgi:hypothetical protein
MSGTQAQRIKGIARHLTGSQLQEMAKAYSRGQSIYTPKNVYVSKDSFEYLCGYLRTTPEKVLGGGQ